MQEIIDGFILLNKDKGLTSFQAISKVRKLLGIKKIGHAGTLDKNASGLLIIGIGKSTRLLKFILNQSKTYLAEIIFGIQTNTDDVEGTVINQFCGEIILDNILEANSKFTGKIRQIPPDFSAVHVNGVRAYKIAMKNNQPSISEREVEIYSNKLISFEGSKLTLEISCSSGTYIRSIARDLGNITGYYAHLSNLKRISIGNFDIRDSFNYEDIKAGKFNIINPYDAMYNLKSIEIKKEFVGEIKNGRKINAGYLIENIDFQNDFYKLHSNKNIIAIVKHDKDNFYYDLVY